MSVKSFLIENNELMKEWNWDRNNELGLDPYKVTSGSPKKVWWICSIGHEWQSSPNNRSKPSRPSCPYCGNRRVLKGYNDLKTRTPELAKEWNYAKNEGLSPDEIMPFSNKKVWWICPKEHEYQASPNNRNKPSGCPTCKMEKQTSIPEKIIFYYINKLFPDALGNYNAAFLNKKNLDIFIPSIRLGIEYDGEAWHKDPRHDSLKTKLCTENNIQLIRFREPKCPDLNDESIIYKLDKNVNDNSNMDEPIKWLLNLIKEKFHIDINFDVNVDRDYTEILNTIEMYEKENSLGKLRPELLQQWDYSKNKNISPYEVTVGSSKMIWWKCNSEHSYKMVISSKTIGRNCPLCAKISRPIERNKTYIKQNGSLLEKFPELSREWNYEKNEKINPENVTTRSHKIVWWKCSKCKHEWESTVDNRTKGQGCPKCAYKKRPETRRINKIGNKGSLLDNNPTLAKEWHPTKNGDLLPSDVLSGSTKKVWWIGECGHEWDATINSRNSGRGCSYCANQRVLKGFNDLETINYQLAKEWHPTKNEDLKPTEVVANSDKKVWWIGKCGHEWDAMINSRNSRGIGCPYCSNRKVLKGFNDLETINYQLAREWHPTKNGDLEPTEVVANSGKRVWWLGECGHEWATSIYHRNSGRGCPYCANRKALKGFNDLETINYQLAREWHPTKNEDLKPTEVVANSDKKVWWIGKCGHEWDAMIRSRNSRGMGCPYCSNRKALKGYNELAIES
ncbi:TPA: zinc-ribbon domain-containing protein [Bacillus cereus]